MVLACSGTHAVAHVAQAGHARHVLQLAVAIGAAGQAVQGVVGDVELHHPFAQVLQFGGLGAHDHARFGRRGARSREAFAAFDLHQAQTARAEGLQAVGGAQLGHLNARFHGRAHERCALGHLHRVAVDLQGHGFVGWDRRCAVIAFLFEVHQHGVFLIQQTALGRSSQNLRGNGSGPRAPGRASCRPWRTGCRVAWCRTSPARA